MTKPIVSIIVPVYKTPEKYLRRFVKSALGQSLDQIELIVVDDASPDQCPQILDELALEDDRMIVIHREENGRAGMARGQGLRLAKGEFVLFADSDDVIAPDMCETLYALAKDNDADVVTCSWDICDEAGQRLDTRYMPDRKYNLSVPKDRARAYRNMNFALWNKIFKREVIAPLAFHQFEANIGEDTVFNVAALYHSSKAVSSSYCGYAYTVFEGSATGRSAKGMPYLRTLMASEKALRQVLLSKGADKTDARFADWLALKRFSTGSEWIAENPEKQQRKDLWKVWKDYFREELVTNIRSHSWLVAFFRLAIALPSPAMVYWLTRRALWLSNPIISLDRLQGRMASRNKME